MLMTSPLRIGAPHQVTWARAVRGPAQTFGICATRSLPSQNQAVCDDRGERAVGHSLPQRLEAVAAGARGDCAGPPHQLDLGRALDAAQTLDET